MPETTIDPLTTPAAATAATGGGIDAMMAQLDAADATGSDIDPAHAPEPEPAKPAGDDTPPPDVVPEPAKPADPAKPAAKPSDEMSVEDMEKFLKAHPNKKPWKIYESLKTTTSAKVSELEGKLKALEGKAVEAPGDAAKVAALEKQIEALTGESTTYKQRLAETAFQYTPKFAEFRDRSARLLQKGQQLLKGMKFTEKDGTERTGTDADFHFLRTIPAGKREEFYKEYLSEFNAARVAQIADDIDDIREESSIAAEEFAKTHDEQRANGEQSSKAEQAKFESHLQTSLEQIKKHPGYGKWFAPDEKDPEASKLLADGFAQVDEMVKGAANAPLDVAAAQSAVLRSRAAAFPRMMLEYNRQAAKVTALEAELAKFRSSDPGARGATAGGGGPAGEKSKGIEDMALAFDSDPGLVNRR